MLLLARWCAWRLVSPQRFGAVNVKLFVLDPHTIYRRGLAACLEMLPGVEAVADAESVREAWEHPALFTARLLVLEQEVPGGQDFIGAVTEATGARVIVCTADGSEDAVHPSLQAGAVGFLRKATLTPEPLGAALQAAASGPGVLAPDLLGSLLRGVGSDGRNGRPSLARLTEREQQVLALIANGHPTREAAQEICYSERP